MKKRTLILAWIMMAAGMLLISASVMAQNSGKFSVPLSDPAKRGKLKVHLNSGTVSVKGVPRKDVLVQYSSNDKEKERNKDNEKTENGLKRISGGTMEMEVSENENYVVIKSSSWQNEVHVEVEIPAAFDIQLHTYNHGDIQVQNIQGIVDLTSYNGDIKAERITGSAVATTYNGDVLITFDKIMADTPMSFSTYNGDIDLTFPATLKASLKMKTEQGEIFSGFDMVQMKTEPVQIKDSKSGALKIVIDEWIKGDINGGGPELTLKNYNGDIYIRKK